MKTVFGEVVAEVLDTLGVDGADQAELECPIFTLRDQVGIDGELGRGLIGRGVAFLTAVLRHGFVLKWSPREHEDAVIVLHQHHVGGGLAVAAEGDGLAQEEWQCAAHAAEVVGALHRHDVDLFDLFGGVAHKADARGVGSLGSEQIGKGVLIT